MTRERIHEMTKNVFEKCNCDCASTFNRITMYYGIVTNELIERAYEVAMSENKISSEIVEQAKSMLQQENERRGNLCRAFGLKWSDMKF